MLARNMELQGTPNVTDALTLLRFRMKGNQSVSRTSSELLCAQACQLPQLHVPPTAQTPPAALPLARKSPGFTPGS